MLTPLENLQTNYSNPFLGNIRRALQGQYGYAVFEQYDKAFGDRADYRLYRVVAHPSPVSDWTDEPIAKLTEEALRSPVTEYRWSLYPILARLLNSKRRWSGSEISDVKEVCEKRFLDDSSFPNPPNFKATCAWISILMNDALQKFRHGFDPKRWKPKEINKYISDFYQNLSLIDDRWEVGKAISFQTIRNENRTKTLVAQNSFELGLYISNPMFRVRAIIRNSTERGDKHDIESFKFANTSWQLARTLFIGEDNFQSRVNKPKFSLKHLAKNMIRALWRLSQAARDAGYLDFASVHAYLVLTLAPDDIKDDKEIKRIANKISHFIREAGFQVDRRFPRLKTKKGNDPGFSQSLNDENNRVAKEWTPLIGEAGYLADGSFPQSDEKPNNDSSMNLIGMRGAELSGGEQSLEEKDCDHTGKEWTPPDSSKEKIKEDQKNDSRWQFLMSRYQGVEGLDLLGKAVLELKNTDTDASSTCEKDFEELVRQSFELSLKYRHKRSAMICLDKLRKPMRSDLLLVIRSIKTGRNFMPFAVDPVRHENWSKIIRSKWLSLFEETKNDIEFIYELHDFLYGGYISLSRSLLPEASNILAKKYFDELCEQDFREMINKHLNILWTGQTEHNFDNFINSIANLQGDLEVVFLSLVQLDGQNWSLLGSDGRRSKCEFFRLDIGLPEQFLMTYQTWASGNNIPWGKLRNLGRKINEFAESINKDAKWIAISPEPSLARLPWQRLLFDISVRNKIISLIPYLSWSTQMLRDDYYHKETVTGIDCDYLSNDQSLRTIRELIEKDTKEHKNLESLSLAIVMGHGVANQKGIPSIVAPDEAISFEKWLKISHREIVIHSCFGGTSSHRNMLGSFGGLPTVLLGKQTRLLCAPVVEVDAKAVQVLHNHIFDQNADEEFGLRYLKAVNEHPSVGLYNLYGLACSKIVLRKPQYANPL